MSSEASLRKERRRRLIDHGVVLVCAAIAFYLTVFDAHAVSVQVNLDFDSNSADISVSTPTCTDDLVHTPVQVDRFVFSDHDSGDRLAMALCGPGDTVAVAGDGNYLGAGSRFTLAHEDGLPFDLFSLDLSGLVVGLGFDVISSYELSGNFGPGMLPDVRSIVPVNGGEGFETIDLSANPMLGITSLEIAAFIVLPNLGEAETVFGVDNVNVQFDPDPPVVDTPEPPVLLLLGAPLIALLGARRSLRT